MAGASEPVDSSVLHRVLGTSFLSVAVGLMVLGVMLSVTCEINSVGGCGYPFQGYGLAVLYAAGAVTILAANLLARSLRTQSTNPESIQQLNAISGIGLISITLLFLLAVVILGLA